MPATAARQTRKKRIPKLAYTDHRGIGWHVSFRDPTSGLPRKHRFGQVPQDRAQILYHQWVVEHLDGKPVEAPKPGPKLQPLAPPSHAAALVVKDVTPGSLLHVATDLLHFDESRTRKDGSARTRGTIHSRVRLNRRKMLLDFLEFMNERHGQGCLKGMMLADLTMSDVESYNQKIALAGYSQSQVSERLQMIHALIERAGRPEFAHQMLGWNWDSRDVTHGKPTNETQLLSLPQLKRLLKASELREQAMIWMGIGLGFGPSDLAAVRVGQIDKETYDLRRGKTGIERYGETPKLVWNLINRYVKAVNRKPADLMFVTRTGKPVVHGRTNSIHLWWDQLRTTIEETKESLAGFYMLRHTGATEYGSRSSISIGQVKRWLGHSASSRVADQYMKPVSPEDKAVIEWVRNALMNGRFTIGREKTKT
jgi:integrase